MEIPADYNYLLNTFSATDIFHRIYFWRDNLNIFIQKRGLAEDFRVDDDRLLFMVLCYYADVARLKDFHGLKKIHKVKMFAYSFYWLLRIMPLQIKRDLHKNREDFLDINEVFVLCAWLCVFLEPIKIDETIKERYREELRYFLKYRPFTAQALEAMIAALLVGAGENPFAKTPPTPQQYF
jgi:hypothetical protein